MCGAARRGGFSGVGGGGEKRAIPKDGLLKCVNDPAVVAALAYLHEILYAYGQEPFHCPIIGHRGAQVKYGAEAVRLFAGWADHLQPEQGENPLFGGAVKPRGNNACKGDGLVPCLFSCYAFRMAITQTVEIPPDRRITLEVPREVPTGQVILTFTPAQPISKTPEKSEERDIELFKLHAERLNAEALDVLSYQDEL